MTFLYPSFLWALAALSVPLIIHLFNFRRTTRVYFSNTRFLRQVKEVTTAKRRLKHYLILASRLLFLLFLVLAFAQPVIPAAEQLDSSRSLVLYIDNSQSMTAQVADKTRGLDAAIRFARDIVSVFPADTRYRLLTNDFAPFSNTFKTRAEALDILAQIRVSPVTRSMQEIKQRLEQDAVRSREIFYISDLQQSTIGQIPTDWDSASRWHLVPIVHRNVSNVFVDTAFLDNPFAAGGERNVLTVRMRNDGNTEVDQLPVKLTINAIQAGTAAITIPAKGSASVDFGLTTGLSGLNKGVVSFNDFPVSFDNELFVALNFSGKINIVEVKGSATATPVERVFGNREVFQFSSFQQSNFNYSLLQQADLVVVNGLNSIDQSLALSLREYLDDGGTLMVIPGEQVNVPNLQQFTGIALQPGQSTGLQPLDRPDFDNPFFENVFEERSNAMAMPQSVPVIRWGGDPAPLLKFRNDAPFLSRIEQGGTLYLMASPLRPSFSEVYNHAIFVPVMYRIAGSSRKGEASLYHTLSEDVVSMRLDSIPPDETVRLSGAQEIVPSQRRVNDLLYLDLPKFSISEGFYQVVAGRDTLSLIAFNLNKRESLLDQFRADAVKAQMGNAKNIDIFESASSDAFGNEIKARYLGTPLWKYCIMVALLFLLAEVLLTRFLK